jgi:hypothetical protein
VLSLFGERSQSTPQRTNRTKDFNDVTFSSVPSSTPLRHHLVRRSPSVCSSIVLVSLSLTLRQLIRDTGGGRYEEDIRYR